MVSAGDRNGGETSVRAAGTYRFAASASYVYERERESSRVVSGLGEIAARGDDQISRLGGMEWNVSRLSVPIGHETASWSWNWNWNVPVRDRGIQYDGLASRQREVLGRQHEDLARRVVKQLYLLLVLLLLLLLCFSCNG